MKKGNAQFGKPVQRDPSVYRMVLAAIILTFALGLILLPGLQAAEIAFEGVVTYRGYDQYQSNVQTFEVSFTARVNGCKWNIKAKREDESDVAYHEAGAEGGEETFYVMAYAEHVVEQIREQEAAWDPRSAPREQRSPVYFNVASGTASAGYYPEAVQDHTLRVLWLALASPCYLQTVSTGKLRPPYLIETIPFLELPSSHSRFNDVLGLPSRVVFWSDGFVHAGASATPRRLPAPYDQGFTNAVYEVTREQKISGVTVPTSARLSVYLNKAGGGSSTDLMLRRTYDIVVNQVSSPAPGQSYAPNLPGVTLISDLRFRTPDGTGVPHVIYTNASWINTTAVQALPEYAGILKSLPQMKGSAALDQGSPARRRIVLAVLVLVAIVLPIPIFLVAKSKSRSEPHEK